MDHHVYLSRASDIETSQVPTEYRIQGSDVLHVIVDKFGISEARQLVKESIQSAVGNNGRVFVIVVKTITLQAQNALLKLFEEPPKGVKFYLVVPSGVDIIVTLLSRVMILENETKKGLSVEFNEFKEASYQERLNMIADKTKAKDLAWIDLIAGNFMSHAHTTVDHQAMQSSVLVNNYLHSSGAAKKMLLEEIALSLPLSN